MANTPYGAYNPYGQAEEGAGESRGIIGTALSLPIEALKFQYGHNPIAWGGGLFKTSGGLWVPFGKNLKSEGSFGRLFTGNRTLLDTFNVARKKFGDGPVGTYRAISTTLKRRIGGSTYAGSSITTSARVGAASTRLFRTGIKDSLYGSFSSTFTKGQAGRLSQVLATDLENLVMTANGGDLVQSSLDDIVEKMGKSKLIKEMGLDPSALKSAFSSSKMSQAGYLQRFTKKTGFDKALKGGMGWAGLKSFGMRSAMLAGKAFSVAGTVSLMWDISKMVGEPIGRYMLENANRVATQMGQKYAPEMGGGIAMSYMAYGAATERQRAVEAISRSYINGRSAIGNEASFFHG